MLKMRKKLWIGGHEYKISLVKSSELGEENGFGKIDYESNTIYLNAGLSEGNLISTLIHEILHGMNTQLTEVDTEFLAEAIYAFLKQNKFIK